MKKNIYISVGNTRTSFAIFGNSIDQMQVIKVDTKLFLKTPNFTKILKELNLVNLEKVFVCSVVPKMDKKINLFFNNEIIFLNYKSQNTINLDLIKDKKELGNDIIASAIFAQTISKNVVVASLGTATVISHIMNQSLVGCIIIPGLESSYNALIKNTNINRLKLKETTNKIGQNTKDSLSIGVLSGHKIMIEEFGKNFYNKGIDYIYFGGNSKYITLNNWKKYSNIDLMGLYLFSLDY